MPNSKMVSYRNGSFVVVRENEQVLVHGDLTFEGSNDFSAVAATVSLRSAGIAIDAGLVANLNADMLDSAHKLIVIDDSDGGDDASIPTEQAVITYVEASILVETNARTAADSALGIRIDNVETELDDTQVGAGLGTDGSYTSHSNTLISGATSLHHADLLLEGEIASLKATTTSGIQWKASVADEAALATAVAGDTSKAAGDAYFVRSTNDIYVYQPGLSPADHTDSNSETYAIMADLSQITGLLDAIETSTGLNADSTYSSIGGGSNYVAASAAAGSSLKGDFAHVVGELDSHIDTMEVAIGLNDDGTYSVADPANYIGDATSAKGADVALDDALKVEELARLAADSAEETARIAADGVLQSNIDAEAATRLANDTALQSNIDTEASTRLADDATLQANITAEATARSTADTALQANIDAEALARTNADNTLQTNIDNEATTARAAELVLTNGLAAEAVTARAAELANANAITAEETARIAADATLQSNIDAEAVTARAAELLNANDIIAEATARSTADGVLQTNIDNEATTARAAELVLTTHVNAHELSTGMNGDGSFNAYTGTIYINGAGNMKAADVLLDTQVKVNADAIANFITQVGSAFEFVGTIDPAAAVGSSFNTSNLTQTSAGDYYQIVSDGEVTDGTNVMAVHQGDAIVFDSNGDPQKFDNTDPSVSGTAGFASVTYDAATETYSVDIDATFKGRMTTAEADIVALEAADVVLQTNINNEATARIAADGVLQSNIDTEAATRLANDNTLQTNIDNEATARTNADAAIQFELNTTQAAAGLEANGSYATPVGTTYLGSAGGLKDADAILDAAVKSVSDALIATTLEVADGVGGSQAINLINDDLKLINGLNMEIGVTRNGTDVEFMVETAQNVEFQSVKSAEYSTIELASAGALSAGSLLHISGNSTVDAADNSSEFAARVMGVALTSATAAGDDVEIAISGQILPMDAAGVNGTAANMIPGAPLYLDASGAMTVDVPVGDGQSGTGTLAVIVKVGYVVDTTTGATNGLPNGKFFFHPQVIAISE